MVRKSENSVLSEQVDDNDDDVIFIKLKIDLFDP